MRTKISEDMHIDITVQLEYKFLASCIRPRRGTS